MVITINLLDNEGNPLLPDLIVVNGFTVSSSTTIVSTLIDNSVYTISIEKEGYYPYYQSFQLYDIDIEFSISLIPLNCKGIDSDDNPYNICCNASFVVIDNPCNNTKTIVKTSSSPAHLYLYGTNNSLIDFGSQIVIPDYLICEELNHFIVVSKLDKDCGCDGTDYPPCYEEMSLQIPKQLCLCEGNFTFNHNYCYEKIYPFIDFETTKFFKQERWYLIKDIDITFTFHLPCIRTTLWVYNQATNSYQEISYRKEIKVILKLIEGDDILLEVEEILPNEFTDIELNTFLSNLVLLYNFEKIGNYNLYSIVETNCNSNEYKKEIYVTSDINLFVNEDCRLYDLIICNDIFDLTVRRIDEEENLAKISFNEGVFTGNEGNIHITGYNPDEPQLYLHLGLDDGVYVITINNGLESKEFVVVHFCNAKNCYISLSKKLYCNEEEVTDRFMYSVVSFYILYKLVIEYYTLHHPIKILETTLSNSDNLKYIEINKALQKIKQICQACGAGVNEEGVYEDCACKK